MRRWLADAHGTTGARLIGRWRVAWQVMWLGGGWGLTPVGLVLRLGDHLTARVEAGPLDAGLSVREVRT